MYSRKKSWSFDKYYWNMSDYYEKQISSENIEKNYNYLTSPFIDFSFMAEEQMFTPIIDCECEKLNVPNLIVIRQKVLDLTSLSFMS